MVLPRWRREIEAEVIVPATRDIFCCGLYTGLRVREAFSLRWDRVHLSRRLLRIEEAKTGEPLVLPMGQLFVGVVPHNDRFDRSISQGVGARGNLRDQHGINRVLVPSDSEELEAGVSDPVNVPATRPQRAYSFGSGG